MPMYGLFTAPILGMLAQTSAFSSISQNVTNMNTGGYKAHNTTFSTVLASTYSNNRDIGGVTATTRSFVEQQGRIISSTSSLDLAIAGKGLFVLNTEVDGSGDTLYTRDGGFQIKAGDEATDASGNVFNEGYVVDKNGYYLQGWGADGTGAVSSTSALQSIRIDSQAFNTGGAADADATAAASVAVNLPATAAAGDTQFTKASIFHANSGTVPFELIWTRDAANQQWTMTVDPDSGTSASTATFTFDSSGKLPDGTTTPISITSGGTTTTFTLDVSDVTSIGSEFLYFDFQKDGRTAGVLDSFHFDESGKVIGLFSNGLEQTLYKLPLATFTNADGLDRIQGNLFQNSVTSGVATLVEVRADNSATDIFHEFARFVPFSHELSNTNLQNEFTHMIMSQQAYNTSATVFKTVDEMTKLAATLKT